MAWILVAVAKPGPFRIAKSGDLFGLFDGVAIATFLAQMRPGVAWWIPTKG
jgi:hypothetical protein